MEVKGVRLKNTKMKNRGFFVMRPPEFFSVPLAVGAEMPQRAVNVGEKVKEGSLIAKSSGRYGSYVYSPCSGKVVGVVKKLNARGNECEHVVIARDLDDDKVTLPIMNESEFSQETLLKRLYESGMVDTFAPYDPSYKKYLLKCPIKSLVINCAEDDPYKTASGALIDTYVSEVVEGAKLLARIANANQIVFVFTNNQTGPLKTLKAQLKKLGEKNIKIKVYPNVYPLSNARLIAYYETGKMVARGSRTAQTSVIVDSVPNCYDFFLAVDKGIVCTKRAVTVAGNNTLRKANYFISNGTSISHILDVVGIKNENVDNMLIYGGIMSGIAQETLDISAGLDMSVILFCNSEEWSKDRENPCINCGRCLACCPVRLDVRRLDSAIEDGLYNTAKRLHAEACISCGACSYVCPAKRYLAQRISFAKDMIEGKRSKTPATSSYTLVEGENAPTIQPFALQPKAEEKISKETPAIEEMLDMLDKQAEELNKKGMNEGGNNGK